MRLFLPISVSCGGVVTHSGPFGGVMAGFAQAVQLKEVSLPQLAALLSTVGVTWVYLMTTISLSYKLTKFYFEL